MNKTLQEYLLAIKGIGQGNTCNVPFMSDSNWQRAKEIVLQAGPLNDLEMLKYLTEYDRFAKAHLPDLVFELQLAYSAIALLVQPRGTK